MTTLPTGWTLAASAFNWTPDVVRAERSTHELAAAISASGVASTIEIELGQTLRTYPDPDAAELDALRTTLAAAGGKVCIVGVSLDDWRLAADGTTRRRSDDERLAFLAPQLRAAHELGAGGVRLPLGQAGGALLARTLPLLDELGLVLYEEAQGRQSPHSPAHAEAYEAITRFDDPHLRLLIDLSMLMPALPTSYLTVLEAGGVDAELLRLLRTAWHEPATQDAVFAALRAGAVPPAVHTLFMDLVVRFGRSDAAQLRDVLPLIGAFHLKFWDLDDTDGRVSQPIRDLGALLHGSGFTGTLCSEWGGHEWLDADATEMTRAHLALASRALAEGAGS